MASSGVQGLWELHSSKSPISHYLLGTVQMASVPKRASSEIPVNWECWAGSISLHPLRGTSECLWHTNGKNLHSPEMTVTLREPFLASFRTLGLY